MSAHERRILLANVDRPGYTTDIACYQHHGGYIALQKALAMPPAQVCDEVKRSGLRGRGGAGFPTGVKWGFLDRKSGKPIYLVVNADESEPGTFKDRQIIYRDPHQLLEGTLITAHAIQAAQIFIYIRGEFQNGAKILAHAIEEARAHGLCGANTNQNKGYPVEIVVHRGGGCYVCGEETGLIESLEGKRGYPRIKPPYFPAVLGLYGCPTIVNNVETMAQVKHILEHGGAAFAETGAAGDSGTHLWGVSGLVKHPGLYEIEAGKATLGELLHDICGGPLDGRRFKALIPGGSSAKILKFGERFTGKLPNGTAFDWGVEDIPLDANSLTACGTSLGTGGVIVMDDSVEMVQALANINAFYAHETCGQCTPCREGSQWLARITKRIVKGGGREEDVAMLADIADQIAGRTICAHGDAVAWPVQSAVPKFREEYLESIHRRTSGQTQPKGLRLI
ncbi:MAG: NADH-quinone oxidoreductase subunit NuoF [Puniceicoccales bacterium]|jgi:NADH-quinone oxidoreductase subunit F|nr:NADH-quinone oxidoreductase subunit NuoF [Puniceicoccales bacterium]